MNNSTSSFLPVDYKVPTASGDYIKLPKGAPTKKMRILTAPVLGYEYFNTQNKPVRSITMPASIPADLGINKSTGQPNAINHFWAMVVWDYDDKKIAIWSITQKTIQTAIMNLFLDEDWGDARDFDIKVTRTDANDKVTYAVIPGNKKPITIDIHEVWENTPVNLQALFTGQNPFDKNLVLADTLENEPDLGATDEHYQEEEQPNFEDIH